MSTPTTATATQSHYRPGSNYNYDSASYPQDSMVPYRVNNQTTSSRLAYSQARPQSGYFASAISSNVPPSTNGVHSPSYGVPGPYNNEEPPAPKRSGLSYADMPPVHSHPPITPADSQPPQRKRRRSQERDWGSFYKHGLPKEIIIIDSSPEAESSTKPAARNNPPARTLPLPVASNPGTNGVRVADYNTITPGASVHHVAKKRKKDDEMRYDPVYHNIYAGSHTPHRHHTPSKSTISSDRTTSAVHTTAATSLESLPSTTSVTQDYYNVNVGQKRKRTTRQQVAQETRRRQEEQGDACLSYRPPPHPPKKVLDVPVKVIPDVSVTCDLRVLRTS